MHDNSPRARTRPLLLLAAVAVALAAAVALGSWAGWALYRTRPESSPGTWDDLGYTLGALLVGAAVGTVVYLVAVVLAVRRTVARGRRAAAAFAILAATVAVPVLAGAAGSSADGTRLPVFAALAGVAALVAAGALVGAVVDAVPSRTAVRIATSVVAALVVITVVGDRRSSQVADDERTARYEQVDAPLALVGGRDLAVPAEGWEVVMVSGGWGDAVIVTFDVPAPAQAAEDGWVDLVMEGEPDPPRCGVDATGGDACVVLGRRDGGAEILGDPLTGYDTVRGYEAVWVDVDGGRWTIEGTDVPQPVDEHAAVAILTALEPVEAATFTAAT